MGFYTTAKGDDYEFKVRSFNEAFTEYLTLKRNKMVGYKIENDKIIDISIAYGGVAATVYKAKALEEILLNKEVKKEYFEEAISLIPSLLTPFSDHRGSSEFRIKLCQNLLMKFYSEIASQREVA